MIILCSYELSLMSSNVNLIVKNTLLEKFYYSEATFFFPFFPLHNITDETQGTKVNTGLKKSSAVYSLETDLCNYIVVLQALAIVEMKLPDLLELLNVCVSNLSYTLSLTVVSDSARA
jgi:hypothetical protein